MSPTRVLYGTAAFLSAFLLFVIEPLAAKQLLPALGGSSAVWLTCLVFFQTTLLLGYLYAHWLIRGQGADTQQQQRTHIALIALSLLALASNLFLGTSPASAAHPVLTIFWTLTRTIGLPFLLLTSTSPLLQSWLAQREADPDGKPGPVWYRLFALSNTGSLLALIAYPTLIEPHLALRSQRILWAAAFVLFALLAIFIASQQRTAIAPSVPKVDAVSSPTRNRWLWFLLPMAAAMQLSAVTAHLTVNIAAIPLLWVLPLAVYLITFIVAFDRPVLYQRPLVVRLLVVMLASLGYALSKQDFSLPIGLTIAFFLIECFVACLFCHGETYRLRPVRASETTLFYLLIAAGGATGTFLVGIAFPLIFAANYDLALAFFTTAVMALAATWDDGWAQRLLWVTASVLLFALAVLLHIGNSRQMLLSVRNFYGSLRVKEADFPAAHAPIRTLLHGAIQHGTQVFAPDFSHVPTTYYARDSGVGLALRFCCNDADGVTRPRNIGVIGLGAGTLAAYGQAGDRIRFYELNPQVEPIARNLFTYLRDSGATITVVPGDARTSLAKEKPQRFDVLVVDAFSGDAIPLHLLTSEAIQLYQSHLTPNGILAFHVSNQYLDLAPELKLLAEAAHLEVRDFNSASNNDRGEFRAEWVLMTADPTFFTQHDINWSAEGIAGKPGLKLWTDDYSSLLPLLQLGNH
ncbi:spermidine synthase [Edaphobacter flagellatus]|uniref:spermidine synthase n=1 Tax=Edaphobacter flagellatus TaxID=1933044 RepID=UPI0021B4979F|nr:fused MFS/spermidine synthase [Edaphobacter flagellatus]